MTITHPQEQSIAKALASTPHIRSLGAHRVSSRGLVTLLEFEESDVSIRPHLDRDGTRCRLGFHAAVRAPEPDLATWWSEWHITCDVANLVDTCIQEVQGQRARFQRMLHDYARAGNAIRPTC